MIWGSILCGTVYRIDNRCKRYGPENGKFPAWKLRRIKTVEGCENELMAWNEPVCTRERWRSMDQVSDLKSTLCPTSWNLCRGVTDTAPICRLPFDGIGARHDAQCWNQVRWA